MVKVAQTAALPAKVLEINEENASAFLRLSVYNQLSVNEARLFVLGISRLRQETGGDTAEITIPARELVRLFGGNKGYYNEVDKICRKLCEKQLVLFQETEVPKNRITLARWYAAYGLDRMVRAAAAPFFPLGSKRRERCKAVYRRLTRPKK